MTYELGARVQVDHDLGFISGVGTMDYGSSTGSVYLVDFGDDKDYPTQQRLVYEEDIEPIEPSKPYIVTVFPPIYVAIQAPDEDTAKGIAAEHWAEQRVFEKLENALDASDFYIGDADVWDSDDTDVSVDVSAADDV